jgi:hypothetical protein
MAERMSARGIGAAQSDRQDAGRDDEFYEDAPVTAGSVAAPKQQKSKHRKSKRRTSSRQSSLPYSPPDERCAARLEEWCDAYNISPVTVYRLIARGLGPRVTRRGGLTFVTRPNWHAWWEIDIPPKIGRGRQDLRHARKIGRGRQDLRHAREETASAAAAAAIDGDAE